MVIKMMFSTHSGTLYRFDNITGFTYPLDNFQKNLPADFEKDEKIHPITNIRNGEYIGKYNEKIKKLHTFMSPNQDHRPDITPALIKKQIFREGLQQLTLCVTEECNFACKYCIYSDAYANSRKASNKKMPFSIAKKAIDQFATLLYEGRKYNPKREFSIAFYGGEPLCNFELIKQCVGYIKLTYHDLDFHYALTTNGSLLNGERRDFLLENHFSIAVSLDGPEEDQNRNRVFLNGNGTYNHVVKNVQEIVKKGYENIRLLAIFDWKSDFFRLDTFFSRTDIPILSSVAMPSKEDGCDYYDQFSEVDFQNYMKMRTEAFSYYVENSIHYKSRYSFLDHVFGIYSCSTIFNVPALIKTDNYIIPFTGSCIPGKKIFVDVSGQYHICERINHTFPIGNVNDGLDFNKICSLIMRYIRHLDGCNSCQVQKTCAKCYTEFANVGEFKYSSNICNHVETDVQEARRIAFTLGEKNPEWVELMLDDYYSWLARLSVTMGD